MNKNVFSFLNPIVVITVIAAVMAGLLGGTNLLTKNQISALALQQEKEAVSKVLQADSYQNDEMTYQGISYPYYIASTKGETVGYAFTVSKSGYGGLVTVVVGILADGKISAVEVTDVSNETPGLGQNAKNQEFRTQFSGKRVRLSVVKNSAGETEVNAVTGATITSGAVTDAVNLARELFESLQDGGINNEEK